MQRVVLRYGWTNYSQNQMDSAISRVQFALHSRRFGELTVPCCVVGARQATGFRVYPVLLLACCVQT